MTLNVKHKLFLTFSLQVQPPPPTVYCRQRLFMTIATSKCLYIIESSNKKFPQTIIPFFKPTVGFKN